MVNPDSILAAAEYARSVQAVTQRYRRRQIWDLLRGPMVAAGVHLFIIGAIAWRVMHPAAPEPAWTTVYVISGEDLSDGIADDGDGGCGDGSAATPTTIEPTEALADIIAPPVLDHRPVALTLRGYTALRHPSPSTIVEAVLAAADYGSAISRP